MSEKPQSAEGAFGLAERLRTESPWELFFERLCRYEIHWSGQRIEVVRGPIRIEGYAVRVFRPREGQTGVGFQASTDLSEDGLRTTVDRAEELARYSEFPAKSVDLPGESPPAQSPVELLDRPLWERPAESLNEYSQAFLAEFDGRADATPSFGSVRATLAEVSLANSSGLRRGWAHTSVDFESAVKSLRGPEGAPPGEYWVNSVHRRLEPSRLPAEVDKWCQLAQDSGRARPPPTGDLTVVVPPEVSAGILPAVFGGQFTGSARLRKFAPELGRTVGGPDLTIRDDGQVPWAIGSAPVDDEGSPERRCTLVAEGKVSALMYDVLEAAAFGVPPTGSASRATAYWTRDWKKFPYRPHATSSTLVMESGEGGSDEELIEAAGNGLWVQELAWAIADPISTAFGGELRMGYRIRDGKLAEPVRGGTVGGVVLAPPGEPSMLASLAAVGSRARLCGGAEIPSLLVRSLTVAGGPS